MLNNNQLITPANEEIILYKTSIIAIRGFIKRINKKPKLERIVGYTIICFFCIEPLLEGDNGVQQ